MDIAGNPDTTDHDDPNNELQVVRGAASIGRVIGVTARQAFYMLERGLIPGRKTGGRWESTKPALRRHYTIDKS
jgi:hypothetical protein